MTACHRNLNRIQATSHTVICVKSWSMTFSFLSTHPKLAPDFHLFLSWLWHPFSLWLLWNLDYSYPVYTKRIISALHSDPIILSFNPSSGNYLPQYQVETSYSCWLTQLFPLLFIQSCSLYCILTWAEAGELLLQTLSCFHPCCPWTAP